MCMNAGRRAGKLDCHPPPPPPHPDPPPCAPSPLFSSLRGHTARGKFGGSNAPPPQQKKRERRRKQRRRSATTKCCSIICERLLITRPRVLAFVNVQSIPHCFIIVADVCFPRNLLGREDTPPPSCPARPPLSLGGKIKKECVMAIMCRFYGI